MADVLVVARVDVAPPGGTLLPQETLQLQAIPKTAGGLELPARNVSWSSSAPSLVEVSSTGLVRALAVGGPVVITATIEGVNGTASITVSPLPVDHVTVTPGQATILIGDSRQLTATAYDANNAVLPGRSFVWESSAPTTAPVTTGGMVIGQAEGGPVTITATSGGKSGTASITVARRPATRLGFVQQPGLAIAGQVMVPAVRVAVQDDLLNTVTNATNSITIALAANPGGATLSGTKTVAAVNGIATFNNLTLDRAGTGYTLQATASGLSSATSTPFDVNSGAANRFALTVPPPSTARSGVAFSPQPVVQLNDGSGNPVAQAGVTVTASIASGPGSLGGTATAVTNASGSAAFSNLSLSGATGNYTIAFSGSGILAVTSGPIALTAGPAVSLSITTQPSSSAQSGTAFAQQPQVQLRDQSGNPVPQSGVAITAAIATGPSGAALGGATTVSTNASGLASFTNLRITGPVGGYTLSFGSTGLTGAFSNTISLAAGAGTNLAITTQPSASVASGAVFPRQPVIELRDAGGNPVTQSGVQVTAAIQTGGGTLGGTTTVATTAAGVASFTNLSISGTPGPRTIAFSAPGYTTVISATITVTAGSASQLTITVQPSSTVQSGAVFPQQPVLQVSDGTGNGVGGVVVTAAIASGGGTLGGTTTATSSASGAATFTDLSITGSAGDRTLSFSAPGLPTATSATITLTAAPNQLSITTQPSATVQNGAVFPQQPVVLLKDGLNNPVSGVVVTVAIASGGGTLGGTATATSDASGVAAFTDLSLTGSPGSRTLSFSAPGFPTATSNPIDVTAGPASQLSITTQPSSVAQSGTPFAQQPVLQVSDASGNPVSGVVVTAAIASGGGTLGGTTTATSDAGGVASFTDLSISGSPGDRTLSFAAASLTPVISQTITVTSGLASKLVITTQPPSSAQSGVLFSTQPVIQVLDAGDLPVAGVAVTVAIASGGGTLGGTLTVTSDNNGMASFTDLSISGTIGNRTLSFSATGVAAVASNTITLTAGPASQLTITREPPTLAFSNTTFAPQDQPIIQLRDAAGNAVAQAGISVTAAINTASGNGSLGGGTTVTTDASGVATFINLKITKDGSYTLKFSSPGLTDAISRTITVI